MLDRIESLLKTYNGRRRVRLLDSNDIFRVLAETLENGKASTGGGTVANAYFKYGRNPTQTIASGLLKEKKVEICIGENSARKGSSQLVKKSVPDIILELGQARRLVNKWRKSRGEFTVLPKKLRGLTINREASLAVGNCSAYTDRIISELGKSVGTSDELFSFVKKNYPDQLSRAIRTIMYVPQKGTLSD